MKNDLFGYPIYGSDVPSRQLTMFDVSDYSAGMIGMSAVIRRENGEESHGTLGTLNRIKDKRLTFVERETGKKYHIPLRFCTLTWTEDIAVVTIDEKELFRHTTLWGMFASCRLKLCGF